MLFVYGMQGSRICAHLPVHGAHDGRAQPHSSHETHVEILLQDERLNAGAHEQQTRVEVAVPVGGAGVIHELDQQPDKWGKDEGRFNILYEKVQEFWIVF